MKIGLIGNMNNNNFAILRYFRDLGADAHLLLFSNDGAASVEHFTPESDTWNIEKWSGHIHQTRIANSAYSALAPAIAGIILKRARLLGADKELLGLLGPVRRALIGDTYGEYAHLIGSGIAPALCHRAGLRLSIFYPYAGGVEFLDTPEFTAASRRGGFFRRKLWSLVRRRQTQGIRESRHVLNAETGPTEAALSRIGVASIHLAPPMYYNRETPPEDPGHPLLSKALVRMAMSSLTLLSSSRLCWQRPAGHTDDEWRLLNKNNHWLLSAFRELITARPDSSPLLILIEYGPDVESTKRLCGDLGIDRHVFWLPKVSRKELTWLLARVDIAAGEFYDVPRMLWGGTGWEAIACGIPLLQGFNFASGEYEASFGHPAPPMLPVGSERDILPHMLRAIDDREALAALGRDARRWFDQYNGLALAKRWLELLHP